jgi:hypothetical protein
MSEEEQISRLKIEATTTVDKNTLKGLVDTLGTFGNGPYRAQAIDAILFIIGSETDEGVIQHALDVIKSITS